MFNYDIIQNLKKDQTKPTQNELDIINTIFPQNKKNIDENINENIKETIILAFICLFVMLPYVNINITKILPPPFKNEYTILILNTTIITTLFWIIKTFLF